MSVICGYGFPPYFLHGSSRCFRWRWCGCCPHPSRCPPCHEGAPHRWQRRPPWWHELHRPESQSRFLHCSAHTTEPQGCRSKPLGWGEIIVISMQWCHSMMMLNKVHFMTADELQEVTQAVYAPSVIIFIPFFTCLCKCAGIQQLLIQYIILTTGVIKNWLNIKLWELR